VPEDKLEILTRGVNTELFNPRMRNEELRKELAPNGEIIFVTVSRIAGEKGFDFLAKAAKELDARGLNFKLYIVGGNRNSDVEKEVQELFDPLREKGKVVFAGFKVGEDLATAYASGDVFLHCSVTETFGLVVLESMASGVPVIARDEGGPSDIVQQGDNGFLIPPNDLDEFVAKAMKLGHDHNLRAQMGHAARSYACEATWEKINNKVAWRMADTIADSRRERGQITSRPMSSIRPSAEPLIPIYGWLMMNDALRETVTRGIVDARLMGGLGVILSFWMVTGWYMMFTECFLWAKGRWRQAERRLSVS
jgi:hypothetical protein